jgi:glycine reductase
MLKAKLRGDEYASELSQLQSRFVAAPPVMDLRQTRLALISTAGLVPRGNPDRMPALRSSRHFVYRLDPDALLGSDAWESVHAGYNTEEVNRNPNYGLPWKAASDALAGQRVQSLFPGFFSLTGVWTQEPESKTIAANILDDLNAEGLNAAVLVAT